MVNGEWLIVRWLVFDNNKNFEIDFHIKKSIFLRSHFEKENNE